MSLYTRYGTESKYPPALRISVLGLGITFYAGLRGLCSQEETHYLGSAGPARVCQYHTVVQFQKLCDPEIFGYQGLGDTRKPSDDVDCIP